jgi:neutral amino acid transport system ATP-binding protein
MEILHGVSLTLDQGEIVAVIGPNGAGKSTLIKTIFGLLPATRGQVLFNETDITGRHPRELVLRGLAYVPQTNNTFPSLTVLENLEMGAITRRISPLPLPWNRTRHRGTQSPMNDGEIRERADGVIEMFPNLRAKLRERAGGLSGGEQQMVALAKSMMLDPTALLIDEPSAGLAPKLVETLFSKIVDINSRGTAIVMVEQNAKKALAIAHRGYVLETGRNRFQGTGEELLHNTDVARLYLGG